MLGYKGVTEFEDERQAKEKTKGFIVTHGGKMYNYLDPHPDMIAIEDIAHALSHMCRFNGHTNLFYSVAQHSMSVAYRMPGTAEEKLAALLHDAAEAYMCDIPSPLKPLLGPAYRDLYDACQSTINEALHVPPAGEQVALYDRAAAVFEAQAFFGFSMEELESYGYDTALVGLWNPWDPSAIAVQGDDPPNETEARFLAVFEDLVDSALQEVGDD